MLILINGDFRMKRYILLLAVALMFITVGQVDATVLTFEDATYGGFLNWIQGSYGGLNWDDMGGSSRSAMQAYPNSGFITGIVSGDWVAYNAGAVTATVSGAVFDFNGAYLTAGWNNDLNIEVTGFLGGIQQYQQTVVVDVTGPTYFNFNYLGIDELQFYSYGGTPAGVGTSGVHFTMDNFTFNEPTSPVPEPSTCLLLGVGLLGMVGISRRRKRK